MSSALIEFLWSMGIGRGRTALWSRLAAALVSIAVTATAWAQTPLLPANAMTTYNYYDSVNGGSALSLAVTGQSFTRAIRISTVGTGANVYNAQLGWNITAPVTQGDLLLLSFWARRLSPLDGRPIDAQVVFERNSGDYLHSLTCSFPNDTGTWQRYSVPFRAVTNHPVAGAHLTFQFSIGPQSFEIGGVTLVNYGTTVTPGALPTAFYYPGREATAPWRAEADARINQHRKGAMNIRVVDCLGQPVAGASVHVNLTKHAFGFGTALAADVLVGAGPNSDTYRSTFLANFSSAVIENHLKWPFWETWGQTQGLAALDWLNARSIPTRGHNLIWPSWRNSPPDLETLSPATLRGRINAHFLQILGATRGKLREWDVINEPFDNFDVMGRIPGVAGVPLSAGVLGNIEMVRWFQQARTADANIGLVLNDYNVLEGVDPTHQAYTQALVRWLVANGAPVTRLGLQAHFGAAIIPIPELLRRLDTLNALPVRLSVTEFDITVLDEALQADYTRDFVTLIFSQPKFDEFLMWGFWEGAHWLPEGAMYRTDWTAKPNALAWRDLIYNRWHTDATGLTDAQGGFTTSAFYGQYTVTVAAPNGAPVQSTIGFDAAGQTITITSAAAVMRSPASVTACNGGRVAFSVPTGAVGIGGVPASYRWQGRHGAAGSWANLGDGLRAGLGTIAGATSATLVLTEVTTATNSTPSLDQFRCVISNLASACGTFTSDAAVLTVAQRCSLADVAGTAGVGGPGITSCGDGVVDGEDFIAFINSFSAGDVSVDALADVAGGGGDGLSPDGVIDGSDFITFVNAFAAGC